MNNVEIANTITLFEKAQTIRQKLIDLKFEISIFKCDVEESETTEEIKKLIIESVTT